MRTACHQQDGGFYTPPPTKNYRPPSSSSPLPPAEPKLRTCQTDNFHIRHKLPAGDSPYVRAKHVQLVDKNPVKAVSLFWAAINSGDRVDSALKDMAVVMKQLDRSDEAIEAIISFRSLCLPESQDSLDNVLVELYKRSGRIEEEIEILQHKLKRIEEGTTFGGKKWKFARCQGRRVQVTVEQETARILGNLAWAYLQLGEYTIAEEKYREGLSLDPDKNMQCNLAYCLLQMHRTEEAKSLLEAVKSSSEDEYMDESYAKSYERAFAALSDAEQESFRNQIKVKGSPTAPSRNCTYPQTQWKAVRSFERKMNPNSRMHENICFNGAVVGNMHHGFQKIHSYHNELVTDSSPVLLTQPRSPWRSCKPDKRKKLWNGRVVGNSSRKLSFEQSNIDSDYQICNGISLPQLDGRKGIEWREKALEALPQNDIIRNQLVADNQRGIDVDNDEQLVITKGNPTLSLQNETEAQKGSNHGYQAEAGKIRKHNAADQKPFSEPSKLSCYSKKSWADMVEEDEMFAEVGTSNKENVYYNLSFPAPCEMTQQTS
ncbi:unnamed protein product [Rhodiola kirilowii]